MYCTSSHRLWSSLNWGATHVLNVNFTWYSVLFDLYRRLFGSIACEAKFYSTHESLATAKWFHILACSCSLINNQLLFICASCCYSAIRIESFTVVSFLIYFFVYVGVFVSHMCVCADVIWLARATTTTTKTLKNVYTFGFAVYSAANLADLQRLSLSFPMTFQRIPTKNECHFQDIESNRKK